MACQYQMAAQFPPIALLPPAADAGGRTSIYVNLRNALKVWVVFHVNQGNAATILLSVLQAQNSGGAGSKAINASQIWLDDATTASDALVKQAGLAATFTTDANVANKIVIFELDMPDALDMANGFDEVAVSTGASNAANVTSAVIHTWGSYEQATPPTALV